MRKEDKIYGEYRKAKGEQKAELEETLFTLLSQHAKEVSATVLREVSPDVVAEIVSRAFTKFNKFRGHCLFSTWVHRIALNECYRELRRREENREVAIEDLPEGSLLTDSADKLPGILEKVTEGLDEEEQGLVELIKEGLSFLEIDKELGLTPKTSQRRWRRLKRELRGRFEELGLGRVG